MGIPDMVAALAIRAKIIPAPGSKRVMKYPYSWPAAFGLFPWKFYWENNWLWRYWIYGAMVSFPIFHMIGKASRSPENYEKMRQTKAKSAHHDD